ncbi:hypothetical protein RB597_009017 [Gaeumannomyces tritici]
MEGLGAAASAIAVIKLAAKIGAFCLQYSHNVKSAKHDIARFRQQTKAFKAIAKSVQRLLQGLNGFRLKIAQNLHNAFANASTQFDPIRAKLKEKLNTGRTGRAIKRERNAISAVFLIDQTFVTLLTNRRYAINIEQ